MSDQNVPQKNLHHWIYDALIEIDPFQKSRCVDALYQYTRQAPQADFTPSILPSEAQAILPGRPALPPLVATTQVPKRSPYTPFGHAAMIHAITHIEFNAINLALDAAWRFVGMPRQFYLDWIQVAHEEAKHFCWLNQHLQTLGYTYGDFPAHDGLWQMAEKTQHDVLARMALVPRVLEARGLDASPFILGKLQKIGDHAGVAILNTILQEEVGHVKIGNRWFYWCCEQVGITDYYGHGQKLARQFHAPSLKPPLNLAARQQADFLPQELLDWQHLGS